MGSLNTTVTKNLESCAAKCLQRGHDDQTGLVICKNKQVHKSADQLTDKDYVRSCRSGSLF